MELLLISTFFEAVIVIAALIYYRNKPRPKWLTKELQLAKRFAKFTRILRKLAYVRAF